MKPWSSGRALVFWRKLLSSGRSSGLLEGVLAFWRQLLSSGRSSCLPEEAVVFLEEALVFLEDALVFLEEAFVFLEDALVFLEEAFVFWKKLLSSSESKGQWATTATTTAAESFLHLSQPPSSSPGQNIRS